MDQLGMTQNALADRAFRSNAAPSGSEQGVVPDSNNIITSIGAIAPSVALITALFYYFGWVYTYSLLDYFGVDPSLVGYTTSDYVLRSINVAFHPFIDAAFAALLMFGIHRVIIAPALMNARPDMPPLANTVTSGESNSITACPTESRLTARTVRSMVSGARTWDRWRPRPAVLRRFMSMLQVIAIIFAATVLAGLIFPGQIGAPMGLSLPLLLIISVTFLGYVTHLHSKYPEALTATMPSRPLPPSRAYASMLLSLGLIAGLWAVSLYGNYAGARVAADIATQLPNRSKVIIYSTDRIAVHGPGIIVADIAEAGTKYRYKYTGLRLLARSSDRYLLLPSKWQRGHDHVLLVRDNDSIRVDIIAAA